MKKVFDTLSKIEEFLLSFFIISMAVDLVAGVVARNVFNASLPFTEEIGIALTIATTFLGIGYCAKKATQISMSIFFDLVPAKAKKIMQYIISLGSFIVMMVLCYLSFKYDMSVKNLGRVTAALRIPQWVIYFSLPLGFFFGAIEALKTFIMNIKHKEELWISSEYKYGENEEDFGDTEETADEAGEEKEKEVHK